MEEMMELTEKQRREQARALKEAQRMAKQREREEQRAMKAEVLAKKEQARAEREALKHEKEVEKEKRRQDKEEAERKKNAAIQKQAGIMKKLFVKDKTPSLPEIPPQSAPVENAVMSAMDTVLTASHTDFNEAELLRSQLDRWRRAQDKRKLMAWGSRRQPKVDLIREPRLQKDFEFSNEASSTSSPSGRLPRMKLLQFHKCFRPGYYGTHSKRSNVVGPRHPLRKDPLLNYEVDSDDEWEEECPGESLSDCDEPEEDEKLDEDDSGDEFVVPDGYFSADEGVDIDEASNTDKSKNILDIVSERALKTNNPIILRNLGNTSTNLDSENVVTFRDSCLKALQIQILAKDISIEPVQQEVYLADQELLTQTPIRKRRKVELADSALPEIVQFLQESPSSQGIKKIVESLSQRFPGIPKSTLTCKIREISSYTGNHWKVKDEVLDLLHPEKKICLSEGEEQLVLCKNVMQKRCLPVIGT